MVIWSDEDGEYIADVPDLQYCSASGPTPEDAVREAVVARRLWLEEARERGAELPNPRRSPYLPEIARRQAADAEAAPPAYALAAQG